VGFLRLGKSRDQAGEALAAVQAECGRLTAEREELLASLQREQQRSQAAEDRAREADGRARAAEARAERAASEASEAAAAAAAAAAQRPEAANPPAAVRQPEAPRPPADPSSPAAARGPIDPCWPLVIAHLERRWAAGLGALPNSRGVAPGPVSAQLTESLAREVDRLREEVGVDVSFTAAQPVEPANPVVFLLTATDLLGAMASRCERVTVELEGRLVVTGEVWADLGQELESSRARAVAAGATVDPVDVDDQRVRVTLHP
jgi:hypothetical protein